MKVAQVITNFSESSLALTKALAEAGHYSDLYICVTDKNLNELAGLKIVTQKRKVGGIYELDYRKSTGANWCLNSDRCHIYIVQCFHTGQHSKGFKKQIVSIIFKYYIGKLCGLLKKKKYDCIDIITQNESFSVMGDYLKHENVIRSFHEILKNHFTNDSLLPIVQQAILHNDNIRVFSDKSASDILEKVGSSFDKNNLFTVPFGLFNSYSEFGDIVIPEIEELDKFVLFFGQIHPYKGLPNLYEAVKLINENGGNVKVVVAGRGNDNCLDKIKADSHFVLINRFISNDELAYLIRKCRMVVCPYLSVSQSGIPQTAFVFSKPIVASNLGAFAELIIPNETGLLVNPKDLKGLSNAIEQLYNNDVLYSCCCNNIKEHEHSTSRYSWKSIVTSYTNMVQNISIKNTRHDNK